MIAADVGSSLDRFLRAAETFFENLASVDWLAMAVALVMWTLMLLARGHAWTNALRASYPDTEVSELRIQASFMAGAGINAIIPARAGDAAKIFLAKQSIPGSSYPAMAASFAVLTPFDTTLGLLVLAYALTLGLLPEAPEIPELPAFEIAFWADNPELLMLTLTILGIGVVALFTVLARRVERLWQKLKQGVAILRTPKRYLREVFAWQLAGWVARFVAFWFFLEAFGIDGSFQNVALLMAVQAIATTLPVHPRRRGRPAGAAGRDARGPHARRRALLLGRPADRRRGPGGRARLLVAPPRLPDHRLARADPPEPRGGGRRGGGREQPGKPLGRLTGMATYALIHGAGDAGWYWHLVEAELRERGHDTVAPDLPDDESAGWWECAATVVDAIGERTDELIVVGHSLGAFTGAARLRSRPGRPARARRRDDPGARRHRLRVVLQLRMRPRLERTRGELRGRRRALLPRRRARSWRPRR